MIDTTIPSQQIEQIKEEANRLHALQLEVAKVIVGQQSIIQFIIMAILCDGHVLLEGVPGIAKTTMIKAITKALGLTFNRIQFTPDLLPTDVVGTLIYNIKTHDFETKKGPIFANLILADEINRAPAKVQSALLEAMQEKQVTIGTTTFPLERPFIVFATQNPVEQEGTYRLPEAQVDRFLFKLLVTYPTLSEEKQIVKQAHDLNAIQPVMDRQNILSMQRHVQSIYVDEKILDYITLIVFATRTPELYNLKQIKPFIHYGASPRATMALFHAAKAHAFIRGRYFATPDDVKAIAEIILGHRIALTYEADAQGIKQSDIITIILKTIPSP